MISFAEFLKESAVSAAADWIKNNTEEFKAKYGDEWEEELYSAAYSQFSDVQEQTDTSGVSMPDSPINVTKFLGHRCIDLSEDEYHACVTGKQPFDRWSNYIADVQRQAAIKEMYHKGGSLLVKCEKTGRMSFLRRK